MVVGRLGADLDRAIMCRVALATIQAFTRHLGATSRTRPPDPSRSP
jgi:hypothetical protein